MLKANWKVGLPTPYTEIYAIDSGESFLGDGERYHVFDYEDYADIKECLEWKEDKNIFVETEVNSIIAKLEASKEYRPNFDSSYKYYTKTKEDSSKLNIILIENTNIIYIIEDIM